MNKSCFDCELAEIKQSNESQVEHHQYIVAESDKVKMKLLVTAVCEPVENVEPNMA